MSIHNEQKGIALYTAIIVAGIVLLLAVAMTDIAFRQLVLSQTSLNSQQAFYVANSGLECALYHDLVLNRFSDASGDDAIFCGGEAADIEEGTPGGTTRFEVDLGDGQSKIIVQIEKTTEGNGERTEIEVSGRYPREGARSVERSVRATYSR